MNVEPLEKYISARDKLKAGDRKGALTDLSQAMGVEKPTPYMEYALNKLVEPNIATLAMVLHESKKTEE